MFISDKNNKDFIKVEAVVSNTKLTKEETIDDEGNTDPAMYDIYVKYEVDGKEYENLLGEMFEHKVGEKINIVYNPANPNEIAQPASLVFNLVFLVGGIASVAAGVISAINAIKRHKKMKTQEEGWSK